MAGIKGRSGRKSWDKERDLHRLWDLSVPILVHALTASDVPASDKRQIAMRLVEKMTPQAQPDAPVPTGPAPKFIFHLSSGQTRELDAASLLRQAGNRAEPPALATNGHGTEPDA